jgi:hypothetical protein
MPPPRVILELRASVPATLRESSAKLHHARFLAGSVHRVDVPNLGRVILGELQKHRVRLAVGLKRLGERQHHVWLVELKQGRPRGAHGVARAERHDAFAADVDETHAARFLCPHCGQSMEAQMAMYDDREVRIVLRRFSKELVESLNDGGRRSAAVAADGDAHLRCLFRGPSGIRDNARKSRRESTNSRISPRDFQYKIQGSVPSPHLVTGAQSRQPRNPP